MSTDWLKYGKEAKETVAAEKVKAAARRGGRRFYLKPDSKGLITFIDGTITEDGIFDTPMYYEHDIPRRDGQKGNDQFVCVASEKGDVACPICQENKNPGFVGVLTVIDHSQWTDREQKVHKNERRLFVYKRDSQSMLLELAKKRGGSLIGCTFEVVRPEGQRTAKIGTMYEYKGKTDLAKIKERFKDAASPLDYSSPKVIPFVKPEDLRKLGYGTRDTIGGEGPVTEAASGSDFTPGEAATEPEFDLSQLD